MSDSVQPHRGQPTRLPHPWDFPGKKTGVGCHFLLQRIFPTRELNPYLLCLLHWQWILFHWATWEALLLAAAAAAKSLQSRLTLSDPMDCSLPGSSVHGIFQARVLEWGAIAFSVITC